MEQWIKARGKLVVEDSRIVVALGYDFIRFYSFLIENELKSSFSYPKFGGHITLTNTKIHKGVDYSVAKQYLNKWVDFYYNPDFMVGGATKGFKLLWMKVRSPEIEKIKKNLKIKDDNRFLGLHISVVNSKNQTERKFQKKMIEIR